MLSSMYTLCTVVGEVTGLAGRGGHYQSGSCSGVTGTNQRFVVAPRGEYVS